MMKIRILFVTDNLQFGGGERVFSQIINSLDPEKYDIFLATLPGGHFYKAISNKQVKYFPLDFSKRFNPRLFFQLKKIIKANNIQIVHGQGTRAEFYARLAHRLVGNSRYISTIAMPVDGFDVGRVRKKIYKFLDRISERFVDRFIVVSDSLREKMVNERRISPDKVIRIYNGIELDQYSPEELKKSRLKIREEFNVDNSACLIGAIGRLVWQKGFEYLISAIPDVTKVHPDVKFLIIGEGPLEEKLKAQGSRLKVQNHLIFTGFRSDIKELFAAIDVFVMPSIVEGFPMVVLEGMAMAKPVAATRIDGINEQIIDGESGILIPPRDPYSLAAAISNILNNTEYIKTLGSNARSRVERRFSVEKMISETEKIYKYQY